VFNMEYGEGVAIALKSGHYWRLIFGVKRNLGERMKKDYKKATVVFTSLGDKCDKKVKRIFERAGLDCNVSFKSEKLYSMSRSQSKKERVDDEMKEKGVVYEMVCRECEKIGIRNMYIGETGRELGVRVKEHLRLNRDKERDTEVAKHGTEVHGRSEKEMWRVRVLIREKDELRRKICEAAKIQEADPKLNISKGLKFFGMRWLV
jgi:hypothetical protein